MKKISQLLFLGAIVFCVSIAKTQANNDQVMCTQQYEPVCGKLNVACFTTPCEPEYQTYGNSCMAGAAGATEITPGECAPTNTSTPADDVIFIDSMVATIEDKVSWAYNRGITAFNTVTEFSPDNLVTREQASKMVINFAKSFMKPEIFSTIRNYNCDFTDGNTFDLTLAPYIKLACEQNMFRGISEKDGLLFYPHNNITKAQTLAVLIRMTEGVLPETTTPWYQHYLVHAKLMTDSYINDSKGDFETKISRGELLDRMYALYQYQMWIQDSNFN
jgi:hypothetical protein